VTCQAQAGEDATCTPCRPSKPAAKAFAVPEGHTEDALVADIEKAVAILAPSFVFGYMDVDDVRQEARLFGIQAVEKWDTSRPFANFAYTHIRNRLINWRRDKLRRNDPPCASCHGGRPCNEGSFCKRYAEWAGRNNAKANLMRPTDITNVSSEREPGARVESTVVAEAEMGELLARIDERLPVELRSYYLQMRDGVTVPKARRRQVTEAVREILDAE
jgi:DNA-directed RNA polymerase specialized sigma24 family protein